MTSPGAKGIHTTPKEQFVSTAPQSLKEDLRKVVAPEGTEKHSMLRDLDDARLLELYYLLKRGMKSARLAEIVQNEWGYKDFIDPEEMVKSIRVFRRAALPDLARVPDSVNKSKALKEKKQLTARGKQLTKKIDALKVMHWNLEKQKRRCEKWVALEKETPIKNATADFQLLNTIAKDTLEAEMKLGVRDRRPNEVVMHHEHSFQQVVDNLQDGGALFADVANEFLSRIDQYAVTMEVNQDGSYEIRDRTEAERIAALSLGVCGGAAIRPAKRIQSTIAGIEPAGADGDVGPSD